MDLISFYGDQKIKDKYLLRVIAHAKADEIIKGTYWKNGKGCAIGCTIHSSNHNAYEKELGLPEWLARLEDTIFELLPNNKAKEWPRQFLESIPIGVKLDKVKWAFCAFLLRENIERVLSLKNISDTLKKQVVDAIRGALRLHESALKNDEWDQSAAWSAAWSAAASAARSAAYSRYAECLLKLLKKS